MNSRRPIYQPTNFWKLSNDLLIPELEQFGLKDYRRRKNTRLGGFAANDPNHNLVDFDLRKLRYVNNRLVRKIPGWQTLLDKLPSYLGKVVRRRADFTDKFVYDMCWEFCRGRGVASKHAKPLETSANHWQVIRRNFLPRRQGSTSRCAFSTIIYAMHLSARNLIWTIWEHTWSWAVAPDGRWRF